MKQSRPPLWKQSGLLRFARNDGVLGHERRIFICSHTFASSRLISPELCFVASPPIEKGRREDRVPAGHPRSTVRKVATRICTAAYR